MTCMFCIFKAVNIACRRISTCLYMRINKLKPEETTYDMGGSLISSWHDKVAQQVQPVLKDAAMLI